MYRSAKRSPALRQRGATTVEFALVLPILVAVLFGAIDGGRLVVAKVMLNYAVVAGARLAAVSSTTAFSPKVPTAVVTAAPLLNLSQSAVHYQIGTGAADSGFSTLTPGSKIRVYAAYSYKPLIIPIFSARTVSASGQTVVQ
jgi:Flp pilus assembly protein TadG